MRVGFLGLGAMGSRMATALLRCGFSVRVWNRTLAPAEALRALGAEVAQSPREAAQGQEVVFSMVRDEAASREIWLSEGSGALSELAPGSVAVECSTITPCWARELGAAARGRGVEALDAPVLGSRPQAEARALIALVGGSRDALEQARPALAAMTQAQHYVGAQGQGAALKLAVNALFGVQVAALAELLGVLERGGLPAEEAFGLLRGLPVMSPVLQGAGALMVGGQHQPQFPVELVEKDLGYLAREAGAGNAPVTEAARAAYARASAAGLGAQNLTGVVGLYLDPVKAP